MDDTRKIDKDALRRCDKIIRMYIDTPDPSDRLMESFHAWLLNGHHCREKEIVMRRLFDEKVTIKLMPDNEPDENKNAN